MHRTASLMAFLALGASVTAFVPGFGSESGRSARSTLTKRGIEIGEPALIAAVGKGDRETMRLLLRSGVDPNARDERGLTPLMLALEGRRPDLANDLIEAGSDLHATDRNGEPVIWHAVEAGEISIVASLLERGVDPNPIVTGRETLIAEAVKNGRVASAKLLLDAGASAWDRDRANSALIFHASRAGADWMVRRLLDGGARATLRDAEGEPLVHAMVRGRNTNLIALVRDRGADPDALNSSGETALQVALMEGRSEVTAALLEQGASPDLTHPSGWNPLHLAVQRGDLEAVRLLLEAGADPNAKRADGRTAMDLVLATESPLNQLGALLRAGANPDTMGPDGRTPLDVVLSRRDFKGAQLLLDFEADPGACLHNAVVEGDEETFAFLMKHGVDPNGGSSADPPLVAAVRGGHLSMVTRLLEAGAATDRTGQEGQAALHLAVAMDRSDLAKPLLQAGADPNVPFAHPASPAFLKKVREVGYIKWQFRNDRRLYPLMVAADSGNHSLARDLLAHGARKNVWTARKGHYPVGFAARRGDVKMMQLLLGRDPDNEEQWIKVDLSAQRAWIYDKAGRTIFSTRVSSGKAGFRTKTGEFVITNKIRDHESSLYDDAEMPYFQRLSCGDFGFHEGSCPGHAASHGCIRVPRGDAYKLWKLTRTGDRVVIVP